MTIKTHILRTASEIAMGRYMRAPDHPAAEAGAPPADQAVVDDFASAFESLAAADKSPDTVPTPPAEGGGDAPAGDTDGGVAPPAAGSEPADGGAPPADEGTPPVDDKGGTPPADPPAADPKAGAGGAPPAPPADDVDADAVLKRLAKHLKDQPADEPPPAAPAAEEEPIFTAEEQQTLDKFQKEWPEVASAITLQNRAFGRNLLQYAFSEVMKEFRPIREMVEGLATRTHYSDIKETIGEYTDAEREEIITWVGQQPKYLQTAYMSVIEEGTAGEVADLVGRYREATGKAKTPASPAPPGGESELSEPAKQAAASLAPVGSKRSVVSQPDDPSDFDGAWGRFADTV